MANSTRKPSATHRGGRPAFARRVRRALLAGSVLAVSACAPVEPQPGDSRYVGQPLIRDADGRITGYIDRKRFGPTCLRAPDGRILGTIEGEGIGATTIRGPDGRILRQVD